jgi:hypothetical protein
MMENTPATAGFEPSAEVGLAPTGAAETALREAAPACGEGPAVTASQLRQAELRRRHAGRWVGWTPDFHDVVVVADTPAAAWEAGARAGIDGLVYELVPPVPARDEGR